MSKMKILVLVSALMLAVPTIAGAIQTNSVDVVTDINKDTAIQVREAGTAMAVDSIAKLTSRYMTNFRTCEPVHLSQSIDLFGLKLSYQFDINGWVDNKCSYYMTGNIGGLGRDIRDVFQIKASDELIAKIKPVVQCNFDQEQLDILVDGFIAAQERKVSEKLSGAESKTVTGKQQLSPEEEKMMQMLMYGQACTIPNQEELMQNLTELMGTFKTTSPATTPEPSAPEVSAPEAPEALTPEVPEVSAPEAPEVSTPEVSEVSTPEVPEQPAPVEEEVVKPQLRQDGPKVNMPSAPTF